MAAIENSAYKRADLMLGRSLSRTQEQIGELVGSAFGDVWHIDRAPFRRVAASSPIETYAQTRSGVIHARRYLPTETGLCVPHHGGVELLNFGAFVNQTLEDRTAGVVVSYKVAGSEGSIRATSKGTVLLSSGDDTRVVFPDMKSFEEAPPEEKFGIAGIQAVEGIVLAGFMSDALEPFGIKKDTEQLDAVEATLTEHLSRIKLNEGIDPEIVLLLKD